MVTFANKCQFMSMAPYAEQPHSRRYENDGDLCMAVNSSVFRHSFSQKLRQASCDGQWDAFWHLVSQTVATVIWGERGVASSDSAKAHVK